ncbi:MAG: disulfide isomerase DsbC N-terminal domain-containing protein [Gammaproteobacteria bacterium]
MLRHLPATALVAGLMNAAIAAEPPVDGVNLTAIKSNLSSHFPKIRIVDIQPSPIPALYEVFTGKAIYYTDPSGEYLIDGELIEGRSLKRLTG